MNGKRVHMYSNKNDMEHNTHQETRSRDEEHTRETIIMIILMYFFFCYFFGFLFQVVVVIDSFVYIFC